MTSVNRRTKTERMKGMARKKRIKRRREYDHGGCTMTKHLRKNHLATNGDDHRNNCKGRRAHLRPHKRVE